MPSIEQEVAAYAEMQAELESKHMGKWVLIREGQLMSISNSFEAAAQDAVNRFGRGPYLIRQVGALPVTLPASVMYRSVDGKH